MCCSSFYRRPYIPTRYLQDSPSFSAVVPGRAATVLPPGKTIHKKRAEKPELGLNPVWGNGELPARSVSRRASRGRKRGTKALHVLPKLLAWLRGSLSHWQSLPQSPIRRLFTVGVQRRVEECKFHFAPHFPPPSCRKELRATWRLVLVSSDGLEWICRVYSVYVGGGSPAVGKSVCGWLTEKDCPAISLIANAGERLSLSIWTTLVGATLLPTAKRGFFGGI